MASSLCSSQPTSIVYNIHASLFRRYMTPKSEVCEANRPVTNGINVPRPPRAPHSNAAEKPSPKNIKHHSTDLRPCDVQLLLI
jgi:hypothetical protein